MTAWSPRLTLMLRQTHAAGACMQANFTAAGGRIGRDASCDWVLEGEGVSRLHASVRHLDGVYFIEDHSTNGVLHNGVPLRAGFPVPLRAGDALRIDAFEIDVAVAEAATADSQAGTEHPACSAPWPASATAPLPGPSGDAPPVPIEHAPIEPDVFAEFAAPPSRPTATDPLALFATAFTAAGSADAGAAFELGHAPVMADAYRAPGALSGAGGVMLPEHWDLTRSEFALPPMAQAAADIAPAPPAPSALPPAPAMSAVPPPAQSLSTPSGVAALAAAASASTVQPVATPTPATPELHVLFSAMTAGLMEVLRARAELKNSLRLPVTLIQRTENNPLKFAATADEAVTRLLAPASPGYLSGSAAIDEAMEDIGCHQLALLAGMRAAFEHAFAQFDPARFEADAAGHSALRSWGNRPWRRYTQHYRELLGDPDERFRRLFGEAFASAYEQQLARAKAQTRAPHGDRT